MKVSGASHPGGEEFYGVLWYKFARMFPPRGGKLKRGVVKKKD
jgi:hypothetical protein